MLGDLFLEQLNDLSVGFLQLLFEYFNFFLQNSNSFVIGLFDRAPLWGRVSRFGTCSRIVRPRVAMVYLFNLILQQSILPSKISDSLIELCLLLQPLRVGCFLFLELFHSVIIVVFVAIILFLISN